MGVPPSESFEVGSLMGTKMVINEFVAYSDLSPMIHQGLLSAKSIVIASFALCGFANFSSIAIQLGGIGVMVPNRKADLAKLGFKAMICGTMASYISATLAGMLM
jgi:CNT family concentrative nucleoside transporter